MYYENKKIYNYICYFNDIFHYSHDFYNVIYYYMNYSEDEYYYLKGDIIYKDDASYMYKAPTEAEYCFVTHKEKYYFICSDVCKACGKDSGFVHGSFEDFVNIYLAEKTQNFVGENTDLVKMLLCLNNTLYGDKKVKIE